MEENVASSAPETKGAAPKISGGIKTYQDACDCLLHAKEILRLCERKKEVRRLTPLVTELERRISSRKCYKLTEVADTGTKLHIEDTVLCCKIRLAMIPLKRHLCN